MTLLTPTAAWWLLMGLPIVALFLLRRRLPVVEVPALQFWETLEARDRFGRLGRQLRKWIALAVHLAIVVLLTGALLQPTPTRQAALTIVLDDSATMQTHEAGTLTRFDQARATVLRQLDSLPEGAPVTVALAGTPPRLLLSRERDHVRCRAALTEAHARDVNPDLSAALGLAQRTVSDTGITVLTDRPAPPDLRTEGVDWQHFGTTQPNIGIAHLAVGEEGLTVTLEHQGRANAAVELSFVADEIGRARTAAQLTRERVMVTLPADLAPGTPFIVRLTPDDALSLDNTAHGVWPTRTETAVTLITSGDPFILAALDQPGIALDLQGPTADVALSATDVIVIDSADRPTDLPPRGRYLIIGASDPLSSASNAATQSWDGLPARTAAEGRPAPTQSPLRITQWSPDSPILQDVDVHLWQVDQTAGLSPPPDADILAAAGDIPLIFTVEQGHGPDRFAALYLNFRLADSNIIRFAGFPVFIWNAIEWLAGRNGSDNRLYTPTATPLSFNDVPPNAQPSLVGPTGETPVSYTETRRLIVPYPAHAGVYELTTTDGTQRRAANWIGDGTITGRDAPPPEAAQQAGWLAYLTALDWRRVLVFAVALAVFEALAFNARWLRLD